MVESSKILTVSYGTFSCTLEGFDDSFSTMKAIAEYFRDLAAGDRYFGAEPPAPDAEMLTRIAEREIARRVEVRTSDTGIVLRASDPVPQTALAATGPDATPAAVTAGLSMLQPQSDAPIHNVSQTADVRPVEPASAPPAAPPEGDTSPVMPPATRRPADQDATRQQARAIAIDADVTPEAKDPPLRPKAEAPAHPDADSVAAKLQRIRAVVGGVTSPTAATSAFAEDLEEAAALQEVPVTEAAATPDATPVAPAQTDVETTPDDTARARTVDHDTVMTDDDRAEPDITEAAVGRTGADTDARGLSDDETDAVIARAMAVFEGMDDRAALPEASPKDASTTDDTATDANVEDFDGSDADDTDDQISAVLRNLQRAGLRAPERDGSAPVAAPATTQVEAGPVPQPSPRGRILRVTRRPRPVDLAEPAAKIRAADAPDAQHASAGQTNGATPAKEEPQAAPSVAAMMATEPTILSDAGAMHDPRPGDAPAAAVNTAQDAMAILADDDVQDAAIDGAGTDDDSVTQAPQMAHQVPSVATLDGAEDLTEFDRAVTGSSLSDEDEADLQRTLAALTAEDDDMDQDDAAVKAEDTPTTAALRRAEVDTTAQKPRRDPLPDTSEAEMSRIMSQANNELADPEASRRRNAIAHLKAAVAATEAARQLGEAAETTTAPEDAFRNDLEQVVRPRRAARPDAPTNRSERLRPAPLKLVASQRIDLDDDAPHAPVQPRRVAFDAVAPDDAGNFAEFAESMGASSLQDLLEAAAAYTAYVEGSEDFSRPHIMQKVRQTVTEDFSREDGLRSFGTLLRQGRIERARNGRFTVADRNRFKPESMAAGG